MRNRQVIFAVVIGLVIVGAWVFRGARPQGSATKEHGGTSMGAKEHAGHEHGGKEHAGTTAQ